MMRSLSLTLLTLTLAAAAEVRGAAALLADQATVTAPGKPARKELKPSKDEVIAFGHSAHHNVAGWLDLAMRLRIGKTVANEARIDDLLRVLPAVKQWPAVADGITAQSGLPPSAGWDLLAALLRGDETACWRALALPREAEDAWGPRYAMTLLLSVSHDADAAVAATRLLLGEAGTDSWTIPPVLTGHPEAEALIKIALAKPGLDIDADKAPALGDLARRLALDMPTLAATPWSLTHHLEGGPLYARLIALPPPTNRSYTPFHRQKADGWHLLRLLHAGDHAGIQAALDRFGEQAPDTISMMSWIGRHHLDAGRTCELLGKVLDAHPDYPLWDLYLRTAAWAGRAPEAQARLDALVATRTADPEQIRLLLAADRIAPAMAALRARLATAPEADDAATLLEVALALNDDQARGDAVAATERLLAAPPVPKKGARRKFPTARHDLPRTLIAAGRPDLAETLLARSFPAVGVKPTHEHQQSLIELCRLYHAIGRHGDVLLLVEKARGWQFGDLADISSNSQVKEGIPDFLLVVAESLEAVGRHDEAVRVALAALDREPAQDRPWALLARRDPAALERAAAIIRHRKPLEDRPLTWLAQLALDRNDSVRAESLARQAQDLDPSDGDQGPGDRMRARAVLAEALERQGKTEEAKALRDRVAAIRIGEQGDRLARAGLDVRAIGLWQSSERMSDRAYCIQSRLAVHLLATGDLAQAEVHFRKAFLLMPKAFGRKESHCFGCEGVFSGPLAQQIADPVFSDLVAKEPLNPKHHYLLGYLRKEQHRHDEALSLLQEAVRLDPDYLAAWEALDGLDTPLPPALASATCLARIRLGSQYASASQIPIRDLPVLAALVEQRSSPTTLVTRPLFALVHAETPDTVIRHHSSSSSRFDLSDYPGFQAVTHLLR